MGTPLYDTTLLEIMAYSLHSASKQHLFHSWIPAPSPWASPRGTDEKGELYSLAFALWNFDFFPSQSPFFSFFPRSTGGQEPPHSPGAPNTSLPSRFGLVLELWKTLRHDGRSTWSASKWILQRANRIRLCFLKFGRLVPWWQFGAL